MMKNAITLALLGALAVSPALAAGMGQQRSSSDSNWQQGGSSPRQSQSQQTPRLDQQAARQVQQQLQQQGYDVGQVDGVWGPRSQQALTNFQRDQSLEPTGRPNQQTLAALGVELGSGSQQAQTPNERRRSQGQGMDQNQSPQD